MLKGLAKLFYVSHLLLWRSFEVRKFASYCLVFCRGWVTTGCLSVTAVFANALLISAVSLSIRLIIFFVFMCGKYDIMHEHYIFTESTSQWVVL